jgi:hypothetical protein
MEPPASSAFGYNRGMAAPSPSRRFQFRLRTLMIGVTLLAPLFAYVGHQVHDVQKRNRVLNWITTHHGEIAITRRNPAGGPDCRPSIPWIRRILGDEPIAGVDFSSPLNTEDDARIKETFPEMEELARALPEDPEAELPRTRS